MNNNTIKSNLIKLTLALAISLSLAACKSGDDREVNVDLKTNNSDANRSNIPECLIPVAGGELVYEEGVAKVDATNSCDGYIYITYSGESDDVKLQINHVNDITYTYSIKRGDTVLPLTQGDGDYTITMYEGMGNGQYSVILIADINAELNNEFEPYRYPNYYVNYDKDSPAVAIGEGLADGLSSDLEVIAAVYEYVIANISYDHDKAQIVAGDYVPDIDEILNSGKGICFDYASLMAAMLRSQRIPTRLEVGYAGDAYHAWVTTYVEDIGWINGIIQFDGVDWTLMDPTFAANADSKTLKKFIGNGDNYLTKYAY